MTRRRAAIVLTPVVVLVWSMTGVGLWLVISGRDPVSGVNLVLLASFIAFLGLGFMLGPFDDGGG